MRWLILILGLAAAALAGFMLLSAPSEKSAEPTAVPSEAAHAHETHEEIDSLSRQRLEQILREADREEDAGQ